GDLLHLAFTDIEISATRFQEYVNTGNTAGFLAEVLAGDDRLQGDLDAPLNDLLRGFAGKDVVSGAGGNDTLDGGSGNDQLWGGNGNDSLIGGGDNDYLD